MISNMAWDTIDVDDPIVKKVYEIYGRVIEVSSPIRNPEAILKKLRERYDWYRPLGNW